ncbi:hypothetical protein Tco_0344727 [Tanacetum coccineum]|uniref:Uncharacterized protein n=1 Tax=Tanacetum coccineum TaxID=301880 RepID=A0ABQ5I3G2_9ASTR
MQYRKDGDGEDFLEILRGVWGGLIDGGDDEMVFVRSFLRSKGERGDEVLHMKKVLIFQVYIYFQIWWTEGETSYLPRIIIVVKHLVGGIEFIMFKKKFIDLFQLRTSLLSEGSGFHVESRE